MNTKGPWRRRLQSGAVMMAMVAGSVTIASTANAVVKGQPADAGEYPWMVALQERGGEQFCGGSLIAPDRVVTAAHCIEGEDAGSFQVAAGLVNLGDRQAQIREVAVVNAHPGYARTDNEDVAVLHLARPFDLNSKVAVIALADAQAQASLLDHNSPATTTGWGATSENGDGTNDLREVDVRIVGDRECADHDDSLDADTMLCAIGDGGRDNCYGDSGGPLVVTAPRTGTPYLAGIVSFGLTDCGGDLPSVYADVAGLAEFIRSGGTNTTSGTIDNGDDEFEHGDGDESEYWGHQSDPWEYDDWDGEEYWDDNDASWDDEEFEREVALLAMAWAQECLDEGGGVDCIWDAIDDAYDELDDW